MKYYLVVLKSVKGFERGDMLKDAALIDEIMAGAQAGFFVRVSAGKE